MDSFVSRGENPAPPGQVDDLIVDPLGQLAQPGRPGAQLGIGEAGQGRQA
jgi:hypothetical protein